MPSSPITYSLAFIPLYVSMLPSMLPALSLVTYALWQGLTGGVRSRAIEVGMLARISGLKGRADLNGRVVFVTSFNAESGRWIVRPVDGDEAVAVRPVALTLERAPGTSAAPPPTHEQLRQALSHLAPPTLNAATLVLVGLHADGALSASWWLILAPSWLHLLLLWSRWWQGLVNPQVDSEDGRRQVASCAASTFSFFTGFLGSLCFLFLTLKLEGATFSNLVVIGPVLVPVAFGFWCCFVPLFCNCLCSCIGCCSPKSEQRGRHVPTHAYTNLNEEADEEAATSPPPAAAPPTKDPWADFERQQRRNSVGAGLQGASTSSVVVTQGVPVAHPDPRLAA